LRAEVGCGLSSELKLPPHRSDVVITACGRLCLHRKGINISTVLAGQKLGIKEVDEGIFGSQASCYSDLRHFDLEQKTLQAPLDNQFGTRLVTYVLGTFGYRCLRAGQEAGWPSERQSIPIER
jgi:hypothetical protein